MKKITDYFDVSNVDIFNAKNKGIEFIHKVYPEALCPILDIVKDIKKVKKDSCKAKYKITNPWLVSIKSSDPVIKVATFNIEWSLIDENGLNLKSIDSAAGCKEIFNYFLKQNCDFICLQESQYNFIKEIPKKYTIISHIERREKQFTFIDNTKYDIENNIMGEISPGRPFTIILLKSKKDNMKYTLINIHCPHIGQMADMNTILKPIQKEIINARFIEWVSDSRIIMAGDFNRDFEKNYNNSKYGVSFDLGNNSRTLLYRHNHSNNTCCDTGLAKMNKDSIPHRYDHVLDSYGLQYKVDYPTKSQNFKSKNASDHEPLIVTLLDGRPSDII